MESVGLGFRKRLVVMFSTKLSIKLVGHTVVPA